MDKKLKLLLSMAVLACTFLVEVRANAEGTNAVSLSCLSEAVVERARRDPIVGVRAAYRNCYSQFRGALQSLQLTERQTKGAFAAVLAYAMAPYGNSASIKMVDLLQDKQMDCDNYALLTGHFVQSLLGNGVSMSFVGFDGGAVGNHAQVILDDNDSSILLDPTVGLVAKTGFNGLLQGHSVPDSLIKRFRVRNDREMDAFADRIRQALAQGLYLPSDLLYYQPSLQAFELFSEEIGRLFTADTKLLIQRLPTPAATALRENMEAQSPAN